MEQLVRVRETYSDGTAQVVCIRESACSGDCHKCSGYGAAKAVILLTAVNPIGAGTGDLVNLRSETGPVLKAAAVLYIVPLVLFFAGYLIGGAIAACVGFALGIGLAVLYDRKVLRHQTTVYTITGYPNVSMWESHTKGEEDLD